ncbi:MAG: 30S ribosomal protein S20 [Bacilli bacterium]
MAHIKQQAKRNITNEKKRLLNAAFKSSVKTAVKNVEQAVVAKDLPVAEAALIVAFEKLDKAISKGFVHKNNVSRNKSRLQKLINTLK